jgi:hypothetical protein
MTVLEGSQRGRVHRPPIRGVFIVAGLVLAAMLIVAACGDDDGDGDDGDPAALLADYEGTRNAGDVDALMALYADDAVVTNHPADTDNTATGVDEIRALESDVPTFQRPEDATEFVNVQVSGDRVTFGNIFFHDTGECFSGSGHEVTVQDDKITLYAWGPEDPSLCE